MRFINDNSGIAAEPNVKFFIADERVQGYKVAAVVALRDIEPGEEILVSYGKGYWEELAEATPNQHICTQCDYRTQKKNTLMAHMRRNHRPQKVYSCSYCSGTFVSKDRFDEHVNVQHTAAYTYWCQDCNYSTLSRMGLFNHVKKEHSGTIIKCLECGKQFSYSHNLRRHIKSFHYDKKQKV
jgi:uncharacterized Zn-finger protein